MCEEGEECRSEGYTFEGRKLDITSETFATGSLGGPPRGAGTAVVVGPIVNKRSFGKLYSNSTLQAISKNGIALRQASYVFLVDDYSSRLSWWGISTRPPRTRGGGQK
jgi:hypothetical protein